jgi:hypothetical protein
MRGVRYCRPEGEGVFAGKYKAFEPNFAVP